MKKRFKFLCLTGLLAVSTAFSLNAAIEVFEFDTPAQEDAFKKLGKELRCPKCQNNNIADSTSGLAQDIRMKVYEMLKQGKSEQDIVDYMIARYGNFVTYDPPLTASTIILWVGPAIAIFLGFGMLYYRSRKIKVEQTASLDAQEQARLSALLDEKDMH